MSNIDVEKPIPKIDEAVCSGCWAVEKHDEIYGKWTIHKFLYLEPVLLCEKCQDKYGYHFDKLMRGGL